MSTLGPVAIDKTLLHNDQLEFPREEIISYVDNIVNIFRTRSPYSKYLTDYALGRLERVKNSIFFVDEDRYKTIARTMHKDFENHRYGLALRTMDGSDIIVINTNSSMASTDPDFSYEIEVFFREQEHYPTELLKQNAFKATFLRSILAHELIHIMQSPLLQTIPNSVYFIEGAVRFYTEEILRLTNDRAFVPSGVGSTSAIRKYKYLLENHGEKTHEIFFGKITDIEKVQSLINEMNQIIGDK